MKRLTGLTIALGLVASINSAQALAGKGQHIGRVAERFNYVLAHTPETFQFTNVRNISIGPGVAAEGGAFLVRSKHQLSARIMLADLSPGHAYTVWWIFFNRPGKCAVTPCTDTDLMNASGAVHFGSSVIAGADGVANVTLRTTAGGPPAGAVGNPNLPKRGLLAGKGFAAEVHLVMVDHGVPMAADFGDAEPDIAGTWGWELSHALPPGPAWVRAAIFEAK